MSRFVAPPEIETARLWLRRPRREDGDAVFESVRASLEALRPWSPWVQFMTDAAAARDSQAEAATAFDLGQAYRYLMFDKEGGRFVGAVGLHDVDPRVPKAELGYWVDARTAGRGYVTEGAAALVDLADRWQMRRLSIRCDALNERSAAVARRLGFEFEARLRHDDVSPLDPSEVRDTLIFARLHPG